MDVSFRTRKLEKSYREHREAAKKLGAVRGALYIRRINEMYASPTLADLMKLRGANCHPLKGNRTGQFAVDLQQPYRLVFEPSSFSGSDPAVVTEVTIIEVVDYHG